MNKRNLIIILIVVVLLLGLSFGVYYILKSSTVMTINPRESCDTDWDGDCDELDYNMAVKSLGKCISETYYNRLADFDRDGCVTEEDLQKSFPEKFK